MTDSPSPSPLPTLTVTPTDTPTLTVTLTQTPPNTFTVTPTATPTFTFSPTATPAAASLQGPIQSGGPFSYAFTGAGIPGEPIYLFVNGAAPLSYTAQVQSNGSFSLSGTLTLNAGDSVLVRSGSATGPSSNVVLAAALAVAAVPTNTPVPADGGATVLTTNAPPGSQVEVLDLSAGGAVLGSQVAPSSGPVAVLLASPAPPNHQLEFVADGVVLGGLSVGAAGSAPQPQASAVLAQGGQVTAKGTPGDVVQLVDSQGRVLGSGTVNALGEVSIPVSGATAGETVYLVQNGVAVKLAQPVQDLTGHVSFLNTNIFNPLKGSPLNIGFQAPASGHVTVKVFNLSGELMCVVADLQVQAGSIYAETWNGQNRGGEWVASGIYLVSIYGDGIRELKKVVVLK